MKERKKERQRKRDRERERKKERDKERERERKKERDKERERERKKEREKERERERVVCGKQREAIAPIQSLIKLQPWFLSLRWKTCLRQNCSLVSCICSEELALG